MDELKQMQPEDESKKKMLDILKRLHLEEEMESDGEDGMFCVIPLIITLQVPIIAHFLY